MKLLIGCPVSHREWILPEWFAHTKRACLYAGVHPSYTFVVSRNDEATLDILLTQQKLGESIHLTYTDEPDRKDQRRWNQDRYGQMADLRNILLGTVRAVGPEYFLSLDSDILLEKNAVKFALEEIGPYDALGLRLYMTKVGRQVASKAMLVNNSLRNREHYEWEYDTKPMDVIMAAKLMKPSAYAIGYKPHEHGEDIGWCLNCKDAGLKLAWCPMAYGKHVMDPSDLKKVDPRVGF